MANRELALVLSGGGVTGVAWETGLLKGLRDAGVELTDADLIVGTSAGSIVGAQIAAGLDLEMLYARQSAPADPGVEPPPSMNFAEEMARLGPELAGMFDAQRASDEPGIPQAARALLGQHALRASTAPEAERLAVIRQRLMVSEWPERQLMVTAVGVEDGRFVTWDRQSGVPLPVAVASSCAVPLVWPPVTINGRRYMDGGLRSPSNADVATGYARVIIVAPMGSATPMGGSLHKERRMLEAQGAAVQVIEADAVSLAAFGPNVLDPARRVAAAQAGLQQAREAAETLASVAR